MAVAALLDTAKRQVHLRADARQVHVAHAVVAFVAEIAHRAVAFGDDRQRQAVIGVVVNAGRLLVVAERDQGEMRAEHFLAGTADLGSVFDAIDGRGQEAAIRMVPVGHASPLQQDLGAFLFRQSVVAFNFFDRRLVDKRPREVIRVERIADLETLGDSYKLFRIRGNQLFMYQNAPGRYAALAARLEGADKAARDG